jgi:hypothetical protein
MGDVASFQTAKLTRESRRHSLARIPLWQDASDVIRITQDDAQPRMDDAVSLGARSTVEVGRMLAACGIRDFPQTYAQLFGALGFCTRVDAMLMGVDLRDSEDFVQAYLGIIDQEHPGMGALIRSLIRGDLQAAGAWHKEHDTLRMCAQLYEQKKLF